MEIGFNAGHSCEIFLNAPNLPTVVSFDINCHAYTQVGIDFIQKKYGERFTFIEGDSRLTIPHYSHQNPTTSFDLIFFDGLHTVECCLADLRNCYSLAHPGTLLWIDDYDSTGVVSSAVHIAIDEGLLSLIEIKETHDATGSRYWAVCRYQRKA